MILLIIGLVLFVVGIGGALINMTTVLDDSTFDNPKGLFVRHAFFGFLYVVGIMLTVVALVLLVI